jgi:hypothetical protein
MSGVSVVELLYETRCVESELKCNLNAACCAFSKNGGNLLSKKNIAVKSLTGEEARRNVECVYLLPCLHIHLLLGTTKYFPLNKKKPVPNDAWRTESHTVDGVPQENQVSCTDFVYQSIRDVLP